MEGESVKIDLGTQFSRLPFGRFRKDSDYSAEAFRDDMLIPALKANRSVVVVLDNAKGLGSSFLDEAFGVLAKSLSMTVEDFKKRIEIVSDRDPTLIDEILSYVSQRVAKAT